jgi:hypothetical protein
MVVNLAIEGETMKSCVLLLLGFLCISCISTKTIDGEKYYKFRKEAETVFERREKGKMIRKVTVPKSKSHDKEKLVFDYTSEFLEQQQEIITIENPEKKDSMNLKSIIVPYALDTRYYEIEEIFCKSGIEWKNNIINSVDYYYVSRDPFLEYTNEEWYCFDRLTLEFKNGKIEYIHVPDLENIMSWSHTYIFDGKKIRYTNIRKENYKGEEYYKKKKDKIGGFEGSRAYDYIKRKNYVISLSENVNGKIYKTMEAKFNKNYEITELFIRKVDFLTGATTGTITWKFDKGVTISEERGY